MKNYFLLAAAICIFSSCKKENTQDNTNNPASAKVKTYSEDYTSGSTHIQYTFNVNYDSDGRLISLISAASPGDRFEYTYQAGSVIMELFSGNTVTIHEKLFLNNYSMADSTFQYNNTQDTTTEKYIYNSNKQLSKLIEYDYSKVYGSTVSGSSDYVYDSFGNISQVTNGSTVTTYEYYTNLPNSLNLNLTFLPLSKNLVKTTTISYGYDLEILTHAYTFDSDNRVSKEEITLDNGELLVRKYTY